MPRGNQELGKELGAICDAISGRLRGNDDVSRLMFKAGQKDLAGGR